MRDNLICAPDGMCAGCRSTASTRRVVDTMIQGSKEEPPRQRNNPANGVNLFPDEDKNNSTLYRSHLLPFTHIVSRHIVFGTVRCTGTCARVWKACNMGCASTCYSSLLHARAPSFAALRVTCSPLCRAHAHRHRCDASNGGYFVTSSINHVMGQ